MKAALAFLFVLSITAQCSAESPSKSPTVQNAAPEYVGKFNQALTSVGLSTNGVAIKDYQMQWAPQIGHYYKVTYTNWQGGPCSIQWTLDQNMRPQVTQTPSCGGQPVYPQPMRCPPGYPCPLPHGPACPSCQVG